MVNKKARSIEPGDAFGHVRSEIVGSQLVAQPEEGNVDSGL